MRNFLRLFFSNLAPQNSGKQIKGDDSPNDDQSTVNTLLILDEQTFAPKWSFYLENSEVGQAILSTTLGPEKKNYIVIGTAYCIPDESESKKGRIIIFNWTDDGKVRKNICSFFFKKLLQN